MGPGADAKTDAAAKAKAEGLLKQIQGGANFADLAKKNSDDPGSAQKGGDLGWVTRGQMVKPFEEASFTLKPKEISGLVKTDYGLHIIQVMQKEEARIKPFDEVKAGLMEDLKKQGIKDYQLYYALNTLKRLAAPAPAAIASGDTASKKSR